MAIARHTRAHQNGTVTLAESKVYTDLSDRDRFVEYKSTLMRMHDVAVNNGAPQQLINQIGVLRDDVAVAHNGMKRYDLPAHTRFVSVVNQYNAWASAQSLNLTPTSAAPATVVTDTPAVSPAPSTTVHETTTIDDTATTTPPPATTTTTVVNDAEPAWLNGYDTRAVQPLRDAVFGVNDKPGLVARVEALENGNVLHSDGTSVPWRSRTVAVGNYDLRVMPALVTFIVMMTFMVFLTWASNTSAGFFGAFRWWQPVVSVVVAIIVLLLSNRNTAPAVEREERV